MNQSQTPTNAFLVHLQLFGLSGSWHQRQPHHQMNVVLLSGRPNQTTEDHMMYNLQSDKKKLSCYSNSHLHKDFHTSTPLLTLAENRSLGGNPANISGVFFAVRKHQTLIHDTVNVLNEILNAKFLLELVSRVCLLNISNAGASMTAYEG